MYFYLLISIITQHVDMPTCRYPQPFKFLTDSRYIYIYVVPVKRNKLRITICQNELEQPTISYMHVCILYSQFIKLIVLST